MRANTPAYVVYDDSIWSRLRGSDTLYPEEIDLYRIVLPGESSDLRRASCSRNCG